MDNKDWKQDPRLAGMNPEKLKYITDFAERITHLPKEQILPAFMAMQMETSGKNIHFSDSETELLVSIISADMPPAEKKKLETLRLLAKKLAARSS